MPRQLFANNFRAALVTAIAAGTTTLRITSGASTGLPALAPGDWFIVTLVATTGELEVVRVNAVDEVAGACELVVLRAQEDTAARAFGVGDIVSMRWTAGAASAMLQVGANLADVPDPAAALAHLGAAARRLVQVGELPISGHSAVALSGAGVLVPADCTVPEHLGAVLGVVADAYATGDGAEVQTGFPLEHAGWTWAPGPVFVGAAGLLTQALPPGARFSQVVGHALAATCVLIDLQPPIAIA